MDYDIIEDLLEWDELETDFGSLEEFCQEFSGKPEEFCQEEL